MIHPDSQPVFSDEVRELLEHFSYSHLPDHLQEVSKDFHDLAHKTAGRAPRAAQTTFALQELLRAKDSAVRAARTADPS